MTVNTSLRNRSVLRILKVWVSIGLHSQRYYFTEDLGSANGYGYFTTTMRLIFNVLEEKRKA